jgi:hypothetical protein
MSANPILEEPKPVKTQELFINQYLSAHPDYRHEVAEPNNFGNNTFLTTGQQNLTIQIPDCVFNWHDTYLFFHLAIVAGAAGQYIWLRRDCWSSIFQHIQHYVDTNDYIVDIDNIPKYMQIVSKAETSLEDFKHSEERDGFSASKTLRTAVPAIGACSAALNPNVLGNGPNFATVDYDSPALYKVYPAGTAVSENFMLPMRAIKNTVFANNKNEGYGRVSFLKLYTSTLSQIGFYSDSNLHPSAGTRASLTPGPNTYINNVILYLSKEKNESNIAALSGGYRKMIPYVRAYKLPSNGSSATSTFNFNATDGLFLQKVYYSAYNATEDLDTAYDNDNSGDDVTINVPKIKTFYTNLNGSRIQPLTLDTQVLDPNTGDHGVFTDWMTIKHNLKGSVIQNRKMYQQNWFWLDNFAMQSPEEMQNDDTTKLAGIPMGTKDVTWSFKADSQTNAQYQNYCFAVMLRQMTVGGGKVMMS